MNNDKAAMALGSWLAALAVGTLAGSLLWLLGGWGFLQGAFVGGVVFVVLGVFLSIVMMRPLPAPNELELVTPPVPTADIKKSAPPKAAPPQAPAPKAAPAPTVAKVKPTARLPGEEDLAARKGTWKYENEDEAVSAPKEVPAKPAKTASETAADAGQDPRPSLMLDAPNGGQADDLKKISGVGPKLEQTLNDLGIYHYDQVARLTKTDIAWVDERLRFKGRIERDDWVGQAKALMKGEG